MRINKLLTALVLGAIVFTSCTSDSPSLPRGDYDRGILISGEGSPSTGTGSVSYVSNDFTTVENLIYKKVNNAELGTFLQSMAFDNNRAFIVVDNQNTISVVERYGFTKVGEITSELVTPRYMTVVGDKGYVTNWGTTGAFVSVYNLTDYSFIKKINIGNGPEKIIERSGKLYVSHKGGFGTNNVISVIDIATDNVQEITVKNKPDELFFDNSGNLVVLCEGKAAWTNDETLASITKIDVSNNTVTSELVFPDTVHPSLMVLDNNTIYYVIGKKVFKINENATSLSTDVYIESPSSLYGLEVEGNQVFTLNASFTDLSTLNVYDATTKAKTQTKSVALGASKIYFN